MKSIEVPHVYVIIMILIILATIFTYILPAGQFERYQDDAGRTVVTPGSYQVVPNTPVGPFKALEAIPQGLIEGASIIMIVFVYGGAFGIINGTGAIESGIENSVEFLSKISFIIIPAMMLLFSMLGAFLGIAESTLAFIPLCVTMARSLGYDALVGYAMVGLGNAMGFAAGPMNMWTTGIAQGIAELPLFSGLGVRMFVYAVFLTAGITRVLLYANRIKKNPANSYIYDIEQKMKNNLNEDKGTAIEFSSRKRLTLSCIGIGFAVLIAGIFAQKLTGNGIAAYLILLGIVVGLVDGNSPSKISENFVVGVKNVAMGAIVIGLARAVLVVLTQGNIIDTILNAANNALGHFPTMVCVIMIFFFQFFFNFIVSSGSGQAATTMPLMVPLADLSDITRQTTVLAFQLGDGISNNLWPTSGGMMAGIAMAGIPYEKWLKFVAPLVVFLVIFSCTTLVILNNMGFGPF